MRSKKSPSHRLNRLEEELQTEGSHSAYGGLILCLGPPPAGVPKAPHDLGHGLRAAECDDDVGEGPETREQLLAGALSQAPERFTYSTTALLRRGLFAHLAAGNPSGLKLPLAPLLRQAMGRGEVTAELYAGTWVDVGTPERLAALNSG